MCLFADLFTRRNSSMVLENCWRFLAGLRLCVYVTSVWTDLSECIGRKKEHKIRDTEISNKNSSRDEIANVNFFTTTSYMQNPAPMPIEPA